MKFVLLNNFLLRLLLLLLPFAWRLSSALTNGPFPNGVPGSGYGCDNPCDSGDVHYTIEATLATYAVPGSQNTSLSLNGKELSMFTRTFVGVVDQSSPFCMNGYNGSTGPLGPCLIVNPGQTMTVKIINNIQNGMQALHQHEATLQEYFQMAALPFFDGPMPASPADFKIPNTENLPGWDTTFDVVNFHLHGMQVTPHIFYPMGTANKYADWIGITPANENPDTQCFCYVFDIASDHPQGHFFYHTHRHGAAAMQAWQGMFGNMLVGTQTFPGSITSQLADKGIFREEPLVLWEWNVLANDTATGVPDTYIEGQFLGKQTTEYLTNNEYQPTFTACVGETIHFQTLCAMSNSASALYVLDANDNVVNFYDFASDGISYGGVYNKTMIVIGQAQREALLMQFSKVGTYRIMSSIVPSQTLYTHPAAYVTVTNHACLGDFTDLSALTFQPGIVDTISNTEIAATMSVAYQTNKERDQAPVFQFTTNNQVFNSQTIDATLPMGTAQQWVLSSSNSYHPFHIHVSPFQVVSIAIAAGAVPETLPGGSLQTELGLIEPALKWRDTVLIPPNSFVTINQRFADPSGVSWAGKTVFHCHNLVHEDQGMESTFVLFDPSQNGNNPLCSVLNTTCHSDADCCGYNSTSAKVHCSSNHHHANSNSNTVCLKCAGKGSKCRSSQDCCHGHAKCQKRRCTK